MLKSAVIFFHKDIYKLYEKRWISKCIDTILNQTYKDFDIFEINYGEESYSIFENIDISNHKLNFHHKVFSNHAQAMNFIIDESFKLGYDVVFNTNLDDYYSENRFEKQISSITEGYDLVSSNFSYISDVNGVDVITHTSEDLCRLYPFNTFADSNIVQELFCDHNVIAHPCVCISKNFWNKLRYNENIIPIEDLDLWRRGILEGFKFKILHENLLYYRIHDKQITTLTRN